MYAVTQSIEFGLFLTIGLYLLSVEINKRLKQPWLNPLLLSIVMGSLILWGMKIPYEDYAYGASWIGYLLTPATVCLVLSFYRQSHLFKKHWKPVLAGVVAGAVAGIVVTVILIYLLDIPEVLRHTLMTKNSTGPIALEIAGLLQRPKDLVMLMEVGCGLFGFVVGNPILRLMGIKDPVARGVAFGATSHIVGTAKAIENSKEEGAMSSVAILITGLVYLVLVPLLFLVWR